jgi:hypothetical protein
MSAKTLKCPLCKTDVRFSITRGLYCPNSKCDNELD